MSVSPRAYVCVCVFMRVCLYVCVRARAYVCVRACVCVCVCARVHTRHRASAQLQGMHAVHFVLYSMCPRYSSTNHLHAHTHTNTHKHAHAHAQTHTHTNTHNTYTHTHTRDTTSLTARRTSLGNSPSLCIGTQFSNLYTDMYRYI